MNLLVAVLLKSTTMNAIDISNFEKNQVQMESLHAEMSALAKKSPNDAVNKFKLNFINSIIIEANKILASKYLPFNDFEKFNEEEVPTNSDVIIILGQYLNCLERLRNDNIEQRVGRWYWNATGVRTANPVKIKT